MANRNKNTEPGRANNFMTAPHIDELVAKLFNGGYWRPTFAAALHTPDGKFVVVESANAPGSYGLPQGGAKEGESFEDGIARELGQELGIEKDEITVGDFIGHAQVPWGPERRHRGGFSAGKFLIMKNVLYTGTEDFRLQESEVISVAKASGEEVLALGATRYPTKARLYRDAVAAVASLEYPTLAPATELGYQQPAFTQAPLRPLVAV